MGVKLGQKWGVKDGNLLASNQVGSRFFNKEFDFSRASNGTYVDRDGLLKTAELYNKVDYSEDFSQWNKIRSSVSETDILSPLGVKTATKLIDDSSLNTHILASNSILVNADNYTNSIYVKKGERTIIKLMEAFSNFYAFFDLENEVIGTSSGIDNAQIENVGNDWYRCSITYTISSSQTINLQIRLAVSTSSDGYAGDGVSGLYIFGAQINQGTEPLDYQYTNGLQGLPRISFEDGVGHLLLEPQRSNLLLQSNSFDTTWSINGTATLTSGQDGIYGTNNAWLFTKSAASTYLNQSTTLSAVNTFSVYAKAGTNTHLAIWIRNANQGKFFDLSNGTIGSDFVGTPIDAKIESVGNGWYRCSVTTNDASNNCRIYPADADGDVSGTSGSIYIQHAQLEEGSYPTSIIETTTTSVTRLADVCNNSGSAQDFNSEGVLYAEIARGGDANDDYQLLSIMDSTDTIRLGFGKKQYSTDWFIRVVIDALSISISNVSFEEGFQKIAIKYKSGDSAVWLNGVEINTNTTAFSTTLNFSKLEFDWTSNTFPFYGKVRNLQVFTEALSDEELESLTQG